MYIYSDQGLRESKQSALENEVKVWVSKSVPLAGMVKLEMKASFAQMSMELSGFGHEKK